MERFALLAKNTKGRAVANLISECLSTDDIYVFSELLQEKNVVALSSLPEFAPYHTLLEIFCFSDLQSYHSQASSLPKLNDKQLEKLRLLSLVDLAVYYSF
jgi:COP9 signalosome complex subunit 7